MIHLARLWIGMMIVGLGIGFLILFVAGIAFLAHHAFWVIPVILFLGLSYWAGALLEGDLL